MRHARTPKLQLSGPTVHFLYCALSAILKRLVAIALLRRTVWLRSGGTIGKKTSFGGDLNVIKLAGKKLYRYR